MKPAFHVLTMLAGPPFVVACLLFWLFVGVLVLLTMTVAYPFSREARSFVSDSVDEMMDSFRSEGDE